MPRASTLGERLMIARRRKGLQQRTLAELAGITPNTISQLEHGRQRQLSTTVLRRLARVLEVSADYLLGLDLEESEVIDERCHREGTSPAKEVAPTV